MTTMLRVIVSRAHALYYVYILRLLRNHKRIDILQMSMQIKNKSQKYASILSALLFYQIYARLKVVAVLLDDSSNSTVNITTCIVLNISSDVILYKIVHFVIIISISKVFQVQNKPMGFLPPIHMKGLITMKLIHARYNPMHNSIDINHYNGYILRIDCNQAESGIQTTPNFQRCLNALAIDNPLEYARLALDGEMQAWVDAEDSLEVF